MRVYLAGTSALGDCELLAKSRYTLESFVYVKPWQYSYIESHESFMLDSGAFTFMNTAGSHPDWKSYIDKLSDFIVAHDVKLWFEVDVDYVLGYDKVREFRRVLENKTSRPCIPVWHIPRGFKDFVDHCRDYEYMAVGSTPIKDIDDRLYKKMLDIAHENGCKLHGLGRTGFRTINKVPYDSVDSTSWVTGPAMGSIPTFRNGRIAFTRDPNRRAIPTPNRLRSYEQWLKFQAYADRFL